MKASEMDGLRIERYDKCQLALCRLPARSEDLAGKIGRHCGYTLLCPYTNEKRRQEFFACRWAAQALGIAPAAISKHPSGRPVLPQGQGFISFSHGADRACVLYSKHEPHLGVDIEKISARVLKVAPRFLSTAEWRHLQTHFSAPEELQQAATLYWTAKEALFKAVHQDKIDYQQDFSLTLIDSLQKEGTLQGGCQQQPQTYILHYRFEEDYCLSICLPE